MRAMNVVLGFLLVWGNRCWSEEPLQVLLLGKDRDHPYATHMYMFECELLAKCLKQTPGVEVTVVNGWPKDKELLDRVDVLVSYSADAGSFLLGGRHQAEFRQLMERGVGLVALHWSTGCQNNEVGRLGGKRWEVGSAWSSLVWQ